MHLKKVFSLSLTTAAIAALFLSGTGFSAEKGKIIIKGSTTVLPITMKAVESFKNIKPDVAISVEGSGSGNGIKAILDGTCDIANSSREMKKEEFAKGKASGIKIKEITVSYDMIVPIVHPSNKVKNLTTDQLKAIYDGSITNWKEVGGNDMRIVAVSRESSSGTYEYWHESVMKKTDTKKESLLQASNGAVVNTVANNPKAIGYIGFGYLDNSVKGLDVNGIPATLKNGKSGKYPVSRKLYMYVNEKKYSPDTKAFVNFLLGKEGQKLVSEAGFIPLK
jgi:phosphate transport system substrate-binding protein